MKNDFRLEGIELAAHVFQVSNIALNGIYNLVERDGVEQIGRSRGRKRIAFNLRAERLQYKSEPRAFKATVPRQKNLLIFPKRFIYHIYSHNFQGAILLCQRASNFRLSRTVSIHCQKPSYL